MGCHVDHVVCINVSPHECVIICCHAIIGFGDTVGGLIIGAVVAIATHAGMIALFG